MKTNGATWKKFVEDDKTWKGGCYIDDVAMLVDGVDPGPEVVDSEIPDSAIVVIEAGYFVWHTEDGGTESCCLIKKFKAWQKEQKTVTLTVTVDNIKRDALVAAIKAAGGKVKK